jgi:predicted HicB family RNase H-like nuclease
MGTKVKPSRRGDRHRLPQTAVRIPEELVKAAKHRAIDEGRSLRALIEEALVEHLKRTSK